MFFKLKIALYNKFKNINYSKFFASISTNCFFSLILCHCSYNNIKSEKISVIVRFDYWLAKNNLIVNFDNKFTTFGNSKNFDCNQLL